MTSGEVEKAPYQTWQMKYDMIVSIYHPDNHPRFSKAAREPPFRQPLPPLSHP